MGRRSRTLALAGIATLAVAACGGDDDATDTSAQGGDSSPAAFVEQADATCQAGGPAPRPPRGQVTQQEAIESARQELDYREEGLAQLSELEPPDELATSFDQYLAKTQEAIDILDLSLTAAEDGDRERYLELQSQVEGVFIERQRIADEVGFDFCGQLAEPR